MLGEMLRTVELGRAVLASQSAELELWLTTLITVSPLQDTIDLQQLNEKDIIRLLSSGTVWVGRGNGMHVLFDVTMHRDPLASGQLQQLADGIINAPVSKMYFI
jgi:hypothetical protein